MKRIGLINVQNIDNYGANLIAFSLEKEVKYLYPNINYITINYVPKQLHEFNLSNIADYREWVSIRKKLNKEKFSKKKFVFRQLIRTKCLVKESIYNCIKRNSDSATVSLREKNFALFRQTVLNLSNEFDKAKDIEDIKCDAFIIGSDVVWKPNRLLGRESDIYFGNFQKKSPKIAYSASIGVDDPDLLERLAPLYKDKLSNFKCISVREAGLVNYLEPLFGGTIYNCIDPVFLRKKQDFDQLIFNSGQERLEKKEYIYVYLLGKNMDAYKYANSVAQKYGLKILFHANCPELLNDEKCSTISDGPIEFLNRIKYAKFVITDSFHGTALSIIYEKQFFTFTRGTMSVRLVNLLSTINAGDRLVDTVDRDLNIESPVNYPEINNNISQWVDYSRRYLKQSLNDILN